MAVPRDAGKRSGRRTSGAVGGIRRTLAYLAAGLVVAGIGAACLLTSFVIKPSVAGDAMTRLPVVIDYNQITTGNYTGLAVETVVDVKHGARYDLYLTIDTENTADGDSCGFDVNEPLDYDRYITYGYVSIGTDIVQKHRDGLMDVTAETYEMERGVTLSNRTGPTRVKFTPTSAWFASQQPVKDTIDIVEVTALDQIRLVTASILQVITFPIGFCGVVLMWIAVMRQLRLIGVQISPPGSFKLPPGFKPQRTAAAQNGEEPT